MNLFPELKMDKKIISVSLQTNFFKKQKEHIHDTLKNKHNFMIMKSYQILLYTYTKFHVSRDKQLFLYHKKSQKKCKLYKNQDIIEIFSSTY